MTFPIQDLTPSAEPSADVRQQNARSGLLQLCLAHSLDLGLISLLVVASLFGSYLIGKKINPIVYNYLVTTPGGVTWTTTNIWFDGDLPKMARLLTNRKVSSPDFTARHPLFWPIAYSTVNVLTKAGLKPFVAIRAWISLLAAVWAVGLFLLFRLITPSSLDALIFSALALVSGAALFWLAVPEVFALGSVSLIVALIVAANHSEHRPSWITELLVGAFTLSITVTNWLTSLLTTLYGAGRRRSIVLALSALILVSTLWALQKIAFPTSVYFIRPGSSEKAFLFLPEAGGPLRVSTAFVLHSLIVPQIQVIRTTSPLFEGMSVQPAAPGSATIAGKIAVCLWLASLAVGIHGLLIFRRAVLPKVLAGSLVFQLLLHCAYGKETFLYSLHYLPLLLAIAAIGTTTRLRLTARLLAVALVVLCGVNNFAELNHAFSIVNEIAVASQH